MRLGTPSSSKEQQWEHTADTGAETAAFHHLVVSEDDNDEHYEVEAIGLLHADVIISIVEQVAVDKPPYEEK